MCAYILVYVCVLTYAYDKFLAKVIAVTDKWDALEKSNHPDKEPVFSEDFRAT